MAHSGRAEPSVADCLWLLLRFFRASTTIRKNMVANPMPQRSQWASWSDYAIYYSMLAVMWRDIFDCQLKRQGKRNKVQRFYISLGHCVSVLSGHLDWGQGIPSQNQHELQVHDFAPCDQFIELENLKLLEHWGHCLQALLPTPLYNTSLNISILYKNTTSTFVYNTSLQHFAQHLFTKHLPPQGLLPLLCNNLPYNSSLCD